METGTNKKIWIGALIVILVALVAIVIMRNKEARNLFGGSDSNEETAIDADDLSNLPEGIEDASEGSVNAPTPVSNSKPKPAVLSYQQALEKYGDKRIQFDKDCSAFPNTVTYKDNTGIMLDNRSAQTQTIRVGAAYTVKGYGFKIITLPDVTLKTSKTILVDCGQKQNVATILVQE